MINEKKKESWKGSIAESEYEIYKMEHNNPQEILERIDQNLSNINDVLNEIGSFINIVKWILYVFCGIGILSVIKNFFS